MYEIVIGIGIICFLLIYLVGKVDMADHTYLRLLIIFTVVFLMLLIPKSYVDSACHPVVNQTDYNNTVMYHHYTTYCPDKNNSTDTIFYNAYLWFIRIFVAYLLVYISWKGLMYFREVALSRRR